MQDKYKYKFIQLETDCLQFLIQGASTRCSANTNTNSHNQKPYVYKSKYKVRPQDAGQIQIQIHTIRNLMFTNTNVRCVRKKQGDAPLIIAIIFILLTPAAFYGGAWYFGKVWNLKLRKEERNWKPWKTSWKGRSGANSDNFSHHRSAGRHQWGRTCNQTMGVGGLFGEELSTFFGGGKDN